MSEVEKPIILISFLISVALNKCCIYLCSKYRLFLDPVRVDLPQKNHDEPVPRSGGLPIFLTFTLFSLFLKDPLALYIGLLSIPVFLSGVIEDFTHKISPVIRLIAAFLSAFLGIVFLGAIVKDLGYFLLPYYLSIFITIIAVAGVVNSVNIIDGLNGLTSGFVIIANLVFAYALHRVGDYELMAVALLGIGATMGFCVFNFSNGKIFLGDGGSYFLGFLLAEIAILTVDRNPQISPWFPLAVLIYPIFEVLFSFYRRKFKKDLSPFVADGLHLHTLLFKRKANRNSIKSIIIIFGSITPFMILSLWIIDNKYLLTVLIFILILSYYEIYKNIVQFNSWKKIMAKTKSYLRLLPLLRNDRAQ